MARASLLLLGPGHGASEMSRKNAAAVLTTLPLPFPASPCPFTFYFHDADTAVTPGGAAGRALSLYGRRAENQQLLAQGPSFDTIRWQETRSKLSK